MRSHDAAHQSRQTGVGDIEGNAGIISIRPKARIVQALRAVGLHVELRRIGRYVVPIVTAERPHS